jgi:hypothetical protein
MAQLDSELLQLTAAASAVALTTSRKLIRNFTYYRNKTGSAETVYREELLGICRNIRMDAFGMHNLLENKENQHSPFLVSLAGEINTSLEELHRKTLFFDADLIKTIIPELDALRKFWNNYTNETFYKNINGYLEDSLPVTLALAEREIRHLPATATL